MVQAKGKASATAPQTATESPAEELCRDGAVTVEGAVEFSGIGRTELYAHMNEGRLVYAQNGNRRLIPRRALMRLLAALIVHPDPIGE
jgi:hypothetical protein